MFIYNIYPVISNGVATIGGEYLNNKGIYTIRWSCSGDEGKIHKDKLKNVLNFPYSPVKS